MLKLPYWDSFISAPEPKGTIAEYLEPKQYAAETTDAESIIREAFNDPIGAPPINEVVHPGDKVCVIIPDVTRLWQLTDKYLPIVIAKLNEIGIPDEDITLLSATGGHRHQTEQEHLALIGDDLFHRFRVIDHQSNEKGNLVYMGTTRMGTPVWINSAAIHTDKLILTGAVCYHSMAGFSGGRKSVVPGVAGQETIDATHSRVLVPGFGNGIYPSIRCGSMGPDNPMHVDLVEAASFAKPAYLINIAVGGEHNIIKAFAGDWIEAHEVAAKFADEIDGAPVRAKCDLTIASAGGNPKDVNLYQASRALANTVYMTKPGGTIILAAKCPEGIGDEDCEHHMKDFPTFDKQEHNLRENYSSGAFIGYQYIDAAKKFNLILISDIPKDSLPNTKIHITGSLEEALNLAESLSDCPDQRQIAVMPQASKTLPRFQIIG